MGVNVYLKSFKKNEKTVLNHLKSLNFYDVNDDEIENYKISDELIGNLNIIDIIISENLFKSFYDIGIYLKYSELTFYTFAYSPISGDGKNENYLISFEPESILIAVKKLISICENWENCTDVSIDINNSLENLKILEKFIEINNNFETLITTTIG